MEYREENWYEIFMRRAVIDIGTNTVKLLVADVQDGAVKPVLSKDATTRLGEGVNESKRLSRVAIARTVQAIADYLTEARALGASDVMALTTSAARDAVNRDEFLDEVRDKSGLEVQVIAGQREAELIFCGVSGDPAWSSQPILVLDVGGGSAEFIQGEAGQIERFQSLPLGAIRLTEQFGDDFAALIGFLRETLHKSLTGYDLQKRRMIGTGGTITTLARIDAVGRVPSRGAVGTETPAEGSGPTTASHVNVDHASISQEKMRALATRLNALPLAERKKVPGLPPERADIIVAGGAVFMVAMELLGAAELTVSVRNLRYGALLSAGSR
jgi:exopolyphosphatase/guanosine-5'-triphosphate,3'-diphosphate pyrophosphatase